MIISNITGLLIQYAVKDSSGNFNDGGSIEAGRYVELVPRGTAPFQVTWISPSITITSIPSPAVVVTYWRSGGNQGGNFSQ